MFADVGLAKRIESAESALVASFGQALRARGGAASVLRVGSGVVLCAGPDSPFSKAIGFGFEPLDEEALGRIEAEHAERNAPVRFELSTLAPFPLAEQLTRRGYALLGFENVLGMTLKGTAEPSSGNIAVRAIAPGERATWIDTVVSGFLSPDSTEGPPPTESFTRDALVRAFDDLAGVPELEQFLARRGGVVAGGASLVRVGNVALLAGAATLPAHRRRGVQGRLLQSRLAHAARMGCDLAVATTQPGSTSQASVQRHGLSLLYTRAVLLRLPSASTAMSENGQRRRHGGA